MKVLKYDGNVWTNYSNGIPLDEFVYSMVMDHESNDGIYLSTDKAVYFRDASMSQWEPYSSGLPILPSRQMEINFTENTVRAGTYGMGIWKSALRCPTTPILTVSGIINPNVYEADYVTASGITTMSNLPTAFRGTHSVTLNPGFSSTGTTTPNTYCLAYIHNCNAIGNSPSLNRNYTVPPSYLQNEYENRDTELDLGSLTIFPNPSTGIFTIEMDGIKEATIEVYSISGIKMKSLKMEGSKTEIDLTNIPKGIYLLCIITNGEMISKKIIID